MPIYMPKIKVRYESICEILTINTEISLADSHFVYNLKTRFFPSMHFLQTFFMLTNHKNFHFMQIPDKNNDMIS